tara:strand:- start:1696 stop:1980 length:285 start_codon:yes stop_codon:yes gene_type:complete
MPLWVNTITQLPDPSGFTSVAFTDVDILSKPVRIADMARDGGPLVVRHRPPRQPISTTHVEDIGMRAMRDQMRMQDGKPSAKTCVILVRALSQL